MAQTDPTLRAWLEVGAWAIGAAGLVVLALALAAELARHRPRAHRFVGISDRFLPRGARRTAAIVVAAVSASLTLTGPSAAGADDHVRHWLTGGPVATSPAGDPKPATAAPGPAGPEPSSSAASGLREWLAPPGASTPTRGRPSAAATVPSTRATRPATAAPARPRSATTSRPPTPAATPSTSPAPAPTIPPPVVVPPVIVAVTVQPGDCLWDIAERSLAPSATNAAIDRAWRAIYAANRDRIGPDPGLIHPGLALMMPPLDTTP